MSWFFDDLAHVAALFIAAESWRDTPFAENSRAKGPAGGIDCVGFVEEVMREAGAAPGFSFPRSPSDYRGHAHNTRILDYLRGKNDDPQSALLASLFVELDASSLLVPTSDFRPPTSFFLPGDILIVSPRRGIWHMPIMLDERRFMHAAHPLGVTEGDITQPDFRDRLKFVFRRTITP